MGISEDFSECYLRDINQPVDDFVRCDSNLIVCSFSGRLWGPPRAAAARRKISVGGDGVARHQVCRALPTRGVHEDAVLQAVDNIHHRSDVAVRVTNAVLERTETIYIPKRMGFA